MKKVALVVAGLGLVGLGVLLSRRERASSSAAGPAVAPEQPVKSEPAALQREELPLEGSSGRGLETSPVGERELAFDPANGADPLRLTGTLVAIDEHGVEHAQEDGTFRLGWPFFVSEVAVEVHAGRWSAERPREWAGGAIRDGRWCLCVNRCVLGGRPAEMLASPDESPLAPDRSHALRVRWIPDLVLDVRERITGRPVDHVLLYELRGERALEPQRMHPGLMAEREARDVGPSLLRIAPFRGTRALYVKGPGLSWRHVVEATPDAEHVLLLDPGGDLELHLSGAARDPTTRLRLIRSDALAGRGFIGLPRDEESAVALDLLLGDATSLRIDGLPIGRYTVQAEITPRTPVLVGSSEVEVLADTEVMTVLALEPPPAARLVPFEGVLVLPSEWELATFRLSFVRWGTGQSRELDGSALPLEEGTRDHYRWALPPVPPGRYDAMIDCGYVFAVDTGPAGRRDARIDVPPPCSVSLRCVDDETGADVHPESVAWTLGNEHVTNFALWNPPQGCWEFRAPQMELSIRAYDRHCGEASRTIAAGPGTNEVVLRLRRAR